MHEAELKLPKTMKDMMAVLCSECDWDATVMREIEAIGFCHSAHTVLLSVWETPRSVLLVAHFVIGVALERNRCRISEKQSPGFFDQLNALLVFDLSPNQSLGYRTP
ncbi:hypothetical protein BCR42DRAFT_399136 [Absidia repens]|uniref:Uncharacterized protein n=1 Tax=Absidia repens TaxID=90262 RepID=A0A1X2HH16_9FUNG|nr:hypothetical protein BCR42DRAFT_399136 [Absidia repens]